ncbi:hypothetical protein [Parerythrobacter lacustris]|uniref:DUF1579 domain-containing protein n=1 Tax=Parerythrobacter lacustris TaxID=2969984 RepID=A0ABT1XSE4_9SPHN|nr:hypothetical protein [Parerythrobacter lacustris]MCR2833357.1 hypothetical protein [Parerythrobacter lacustris]
MNRTGKAAFLAIALAATQVHAEDEVAIELETPAEQFETIRSWEGRWQVAETPALEIVFETTARGTAMIERWETKSGLHSITIYHMDGDALVATHYCPQGNQPRLETRSSANGDIRFAFRDVTDLDKGESHTHDLWFSSAADGTIRRSEIYRGEDGLQEPSHYTLRRAPPAE